MLDILPITGVIFVLIGIGYLSVRMGALTPADMGGAGKVVLGFELPALIFRAAPSRPLAEIASPGYLAAVLGGSLFVFAAGELWLKMGDGVREDGVSWRVVKPTRTSRRSDTP